MIKRKKYTYLLQIILLSEKSLLYPLHTKCKKKKEKKQASVKHFKKYTFDEKNEKKKISITYFFKKRYLIIPKLVTLWSP